MGKKMYLYLGILFLLVFISLLGDIVYAIIQNEHQFKWKEIVYLIGWLLLTIFSLSQYYNR